MNSFKGVKRSNTAMLAMLGTTIVSAILTGCSAMPVSLSGAAAGDSLQVGTIQGKVHGGQQPVTGAVIQLYSAGLTGYGSAATLLLPTSGAGLVTSDSLGDFSLPAYTCPSNSYVYLTATGGNPGIDGSSNSDIAMMAALGSCATLQANAATTFIFVDEVTTVAAVWALQQFIGITPGATLYSTPGGGGTTPAFTVGTSATNLQGLINAFGIANVLANTTTGSSPGSNTSNTQSNVEYWQVNTVADILSSCINSDPSSSTSCSSLFTTAQVGTSTAPADTLQVAWTMAQNPGNNVQALLGKASANAPFQPADNYVNDWTIGFAVTPSATYGTALASPYWISFDGYGNSWVTNPGSSTVSGFVTEFDPQGNQIGGKINSYNLGSTSSPNVVTIGTESTPMMVVVDPSNNAWVSDHSGGAIFRIAGSGSAAGANGGGGAAAYAISTGTNSLPSALTIDGKGTVWATLDGATGYNATFGTSGNQGVAGINPSIGSGGPLSGGFMAANPGAATAAGYGLIVDTTPASTYAAAPFLFATNNKVGCTGNVGTINNYFAGLAATVSGSVSSTTTVQGGVTPANIIADAGDACAGSGATLPAQSVSYLGTNYSNVPAISTPLGTAVDGLDDIWVLNTAAPSSAASGYPAITLTRLVPSYSTNATTGALEPSFTPSIFTGGPTSGTTAGGLPTFSTPQFLAVDGANNVWVTTQAISSPLPLSSFAEFDLNGTSLSPTAPTSITSTRTASGWFGGNTGTSTQRASESRRGLAIDLSGNVWDTNAASAGVSLFVLVGAAAPTVTPISEALRTGKVGTRP